MAKEYVKISSQITINVTCGLQSKNLTHKDERLSDRLRVNPLWQKGTVLIRQGVDIYPAQVAEYQTVKDLVKAEKMTIMGYVDADDKSITDEKKEIKTQLDKAIGKIEKESGEVVVKKQTIVKDVDLAAIAEGK